MQAVFAFVPALPLANISDDDARSHAEEIVASVREEHVPLIEAQVEAALRKYRDAITTFMVPDNIWMLRTSFRCSDDISKSSERSYIASCRNATGAAAGKTRQLSALLKAID